MIKIIAITIVLYVVFCDGFNIESRIINGQKSAPFKYPFYVFLTIYNAEGVEFMCGGTLISDIWVLTAAHCMVENTSVEVHLGSRSDGTFERSYTVEEYDQYIHPNYSHCEEGYDLCLLELPARIESGRLIRPVQLPDTCGTNIYAQNVVSVGKGWTTFEKYTGDQYLRYADLIVLPVADCNLYAAEVFDAKSVICAFSTSGQTIYAGDSGGPLLLNDKLIGVTSYTQEYPVSFMGHSPFVIQTFTNIHYYFGWIAEMTGLELPHC